MERTEELAQSILDCVETDITGWRVVDASAVPFMIEQLNKNGWLESIKESAIIQHQMKKHETT